MTSASIWTVTSAQLKWFIGMTIVLTVAGIAWWAYYWMYYVCVTYSNQVRGSMYCADDYYGYEVLVLRLGSVALSSTVLSAIMLVLWNLGRGVFRLILGIGKPRGHDRVEAP